MSFSNQSYVTGGAGRAIPVSPHSHIHLVSSCLGYQVWIRLPQRRPWLVACMLKQGLFTWACGLGKSQASSVLLRCLGPCISCVYLPYTASQRELGLWCTECKVHTSDPGPRTKPLTPEAHNNCFLKWTQLWLCLELEAMGDFIDVYVIL